MPRVLGLTLLFISLPTLAATWTPIAEDALRPATLDQFSPSIAPDGHGGWLTAWSDGRALVDGNIPNRDVYTTRIFGSGEPAGDGGVPVSPTQFDDVGPSVVWNGSENVVVAVESIQQQMILTRVGIDGPGTGVRIDVPWQFSASSKTSVAWNGSEYLVVASSLEAGNLYPGNPAPSQRVDALLIDRDFHLIGQPFEIGRIDLQNFQASVASNGDGFLVSWMSSATGGDDKHVRIATVSAAGTVDERSVALAEFTLPWFFTYAPAVAWDGSHYFVVWSDHAILGELVGGDGTPAGGPVTVAWAEGIEALAPTAASNGSEFLVTWASLNDWVSAAQPPTTNLYAARVKGDGTLVDQPVPLTISTAPGAQTVSAIAANDSSFEIVWETDALKGHDIHSARVAGDGTVSPERVPARSVGTQTISAVAWDGSALAFAWLEEGSAMFGRTTLDGQPLDGGGIVLGPGSEQILPRLAVTNGDTYVVWEDNTNTAIHAARILRNGQALSVIDVGQGWLWDVATDGNTVAVIWSEAFLKPLRSSVIDGDRLTTNPDPIAPPQFAQENAQIVWSGARYIVNYFEYLQPFGQTKITPGESRQVTLDRAALPLSGVRSYGGWPVGRSLISAAGGGRVLNVNGIGTITGQFADADGIPTGPSFTIAKCGCMADAVLWSGTDFVVFHGNPAERVSLDGVVTPLPLANAPTMRTRRTFVAPNLLAVASDQWVPVMPGIHRGAIQRSLFALQPLQRTRIARH